MPMNRATLELFAPLDRSSPTPLRNQLEDAICAAITGGGAPPGTKLPASRVLAEALQVSRGVVSEAYAQIEAEGWIEIRRGSAPVVRTVPAAPAAHLALGVPAAPAGSASPGSHRGAGRLPSDECPRRDGPPRRPGPRCGSGRAGRPGRRGGAWRPRLAGRSRVGGRPLRSGRPAPCQASSPRPASTSPRPRPTSRSSRAACGRRRCGGRSRRCPMRRSTTATRPATASCVPSSRPTSCASADSPPPISSSRAVTRKGCG